MAFRFNGILKFNADGAVAGMNRASKGVVRLKKNFASLGNNLGKINQGIRGAALAAAPLTAGLAFATKTAADFQAQMSVVKSVMLATDEEMVALNDTTKLLGATTAFTAKEAGEGAEFLARAGFTAEQVVAALPGVLDAAAASGTGLGETANIVAGQLGAFGLKASQAGEVADALSLTTALTNTNFIQLGESMKFAAPIAKQAGISLAETASAMGVLANAGIKGSLAGTALKNALIKLSKPSKEAIKLFGSKEGMAKATLETVEVNGKLVTRLKPLSAIMANISKVVAKAKNPLEATATAAEIFGIRGTAAFSSFSQKLTDTTKINSKNIDAIRLGIERTGERITISIGDSLPALEALRFRIEGATGTAKEMARIRLDNLLGQFTLFKSAVSGLSIEMGALTQGPFKNMLKTATDFLSVMTVGFQAAAKGGKATDAQLKALADNRFKDLLDAAIEFSDGFVAGFNEIKASFKETFDTISALLKPILGETGLTVKEFGKFAAKFIVIGAIAAPILGTIAAGLFVLGPMIAGIVGLFGAMTSVIGILVGVSQIGFGIIVAAIGVVGAPIFLIISAIVAVIAAVIIWRKEIGDFASTAFRTLSNLAVSLAQPFINLGQIILSALTDPITTFVSLLKGMIGGLASLLGDTLLSKIGLSKGQVDSFLASAPGNEALDRVLLGESPPAGQASIAAKTLSVSQESAGLSAESLKGTGLIGGPSSEQVAKIAANAAARVPISGGGQSSNVNVRVQVEGKIRGRDLNIVTTKEQIRQSELNGRQVNPAIKRRLSQNGAQATGV